MTRKEAMTGKEVSQADGKSRSLGVERVRDCSKTEAVTFQMFYQVAAGLLTLSLRPLMPTGEAQAAPGRASAAKGVGLVVLEVLCH